MKPLLRKYYIHFKRQTRYIIYLVCLFYITDTYSQSKNFKQISKLLDQSFEQQTKDPDSCLKIAELALELSIQDKYNKGIAEAQMRIGYSYYMKGIYDSALLNLRPAFSIRKKENDIEGAIGTASVISYIYQSTGKKDSAFAILFESLKLSEKSKKETTKAGIFMDLGNLYVYYNQADTSLKYAKEAERLYTLANDNEGLSLACGSIGNSYFYLKNLNKALWYFLKTDSLLHITDDQTAIARNHNNIALCYDGLNNHPKAIQFYREALSYYTQYHMLSDMALVNNNISGTYLNLNKPDSAIKYGQSGLLYANQSNNIEEKVHALKMLAEAYKQKGNFGLAFEYLSQYNSWNDSLINYQKVKQIAEMQTLYETEKKEQQIALLDSKNKIEAARRNIFIIGTILFLLLTIAVLIGLIKTRKQKKISEMLLLNILPSEVAEELKLKGEAEAQLIENVTVLFTDFKGFTQLSEQMSPKELVAEIHECFSAFDLIMQKHHVEKIKTIGDAYMAAGGLPIPNDTHPFDVILAALEIQEFMNSHKAKKEAAGKLFFEIRIGVHTGPVVAGIVGVKKFAYDIWGDTVNTASRMESSGGVGKVNISETTYELVKEKFNCSYRGKIQAKGKGEIDMYFVENKIS